MTGLVTALDCSTDLMSKFAFAEIISGEVKTDGCSREHSDPRPPPVEHEASTKGSCRIVPVPLRHNDRISHHASLKDGRCRSYRHPLRDVLPVPRGRRRPPHSLIDGIPDLLRHPARAHSLPRSNEEALILLQKYGFTEENVRYESR